MMFASKIRDLVLVNRPQDRTIDDHKRMVIIRGEKAEFTRGRYETQNPEIIEWLLHHPLYGLEFTVVGGDQELMKHKKMQEVAMGEGARSSVNYSSLVTEVKPDPEIVKAALAEVGLVSDKSPQEKSVTMDDVKAVVNQAISEAMTDLISAIRQPASEQQRKDPYNLSKEEKILNKMPLRVFKCPAPGCGEVFPSGFDVGKHKKEVHPELFGKKGE